MDIIITIVGLAIGMLIGGAILFGIIKSSRAKFDVSFLEDEKEWEEVEMQENSDEEMSEK